MREELLRALNAQRALVEHTLPLDDGLAYLDGRGSRVEGREPELAPSPQALAPSFFPGDVPDLDLSQQTPPRDWLYWDDPCNVDQQAADASKGLGLSLCVLATVVVWWAIVSVLVAAWRML